MRTLKIAAALALTLAPALQAQGQGALGNLREQTAPAAGQTPQASGPSSGKFTDTDKAGAPLPQKEWTVMVFVNGKNNLNNAALADLNEMESVGSDDNINIVAESGIGYNGDVRMRRYYIRKDADTTKVSSPVLAEASGVNMGDPAAIVEFVAWAEKQFPAKRYMLIGWDHGSGWLKGNPVPKTTSRGFSDDWVTKNNISIPQLGELLAGIESAGGRVDLLGFDACLMQMAEVLYEIKGTKVAYMAASEEIEPENGYPYDKWLAPLAADPTMDARKLGSLVARKYIDDYPDGFQGLGMTYALTDTAGAKGLAARMNALAGAALASGDKAAFLKARDKAAYYNYDYDYPNGVYDNKDLRDFAGLVASYAKDEKVKAAAKQLVAYLAPGKGIVVTSGVSKNKPTRSFGVAVYIPSKSLDRNYLELKLAGDTKWPQMLAWMLKK